MEPNISDGMCRCCASEGSSKDIQTTYHWMGVEEIYSDMLKDCFNITLATSEVIHNGGICELCISQLRNAYNFKRQVQVTEEQFKKKVRESVFESSSIKLEISQDDVESDNVASENLSDADYEVPIKEEKQEEKPKKRQAKASTSKAKKTKTEGETSKRVRPTKISKHTREIRKLLDIRNGKRVNITLKKSSTGRNEVEKHQNNIKEILLTSNATPIRCRGGIGYACSFCTEQYPEPANLKKHTLEKHGDEDKSNFMKGKDMHGYFVKLDVTALKCNLCELSIDNLEKLADHLKNVHQRKFYTDIKNHILPFKFQNELLECFMCLNVFNSFKALQEHMNVHYRNYICTVCSAGFVNKNILLRHSDAHKTGTFSCEACSRTFDTARKKRLHDRAKHPGETLPHKCGYCEERFKEVRKKHEHLSKVHGIKGPGIKCQACDKSFDKKHAWRLHTTRVHLLERPHKCSHCDMEFYAKRELASHMIKHTGTREFKCDVCFKHYGRQKTLKEHVRRVHS